MGYIFSGYILVLCNLTITMNEIAFDVFPDFIGYFLILWGIKYFISQDECFKKALPFCVFLTIYSIFYFVVDFFGLGNVIGSYMLFTNILSFGSKLYMTYLFLEGMKRLEQKKCKNFNVVSTYKVFTILAAFEILSFVSVFVDILFATIMLLATIVTVIAFLYQLFHMMKYWKTQL